jgi:hypothetical protein
LSLMNFFTLFFLTPIVKRNKQLCKVDVSPSPEEEAKKSGKVRQIGGVTTAKRAK